MSKETGTYNYLSKSEALKNIEIFTSRFKRGKITTDEYISKVHKSLQTLTNKRDYYKYLESIGQ